MKTLEQISQSQADWSLDEFVEAANELLPEFLPVEKGNTRIREQVTPRLVRHHATLGMLDEPQKVGREARYTYRHLLQLLVVRRLLAEGYGASAIDDLATTSNNAQLEALLHGGAQLRVTVANPALAFLQEIQQRSAAPKPTRQPSKPTIASPPSTQPVTTFWTRIEILPDLEINIRDDFAYPRSSHEQQALLARIAQHLEAFSSKRRSPK
jgi:hypothetical protein